MYGVSTLLRNKNGLEHGQFGAKHVSVEIGFTSMVIEPSQKVVILGENRDPELGNINK